MEVPSLAELAATEDYVSLSEEQRLELIGFWKSGSPTLNLDPGTPLYSNMVVHTGEAQALNKVRCDYVRKTSSLYELQQNPALADAEAVDRILSNSPTLKRRQQQPAVGVFAMVMPTKAITIIPRGAIFYKNDLEWKTEQTWIGKPGNLTESTNRLMTKLSDGTWMFTFPVIANGVGDAYNIRAGTEVAWRDTRAKALRIYADTDFQSGVAAETLEELAERLDSGMAAPGIAGRMNIEALLRWKFPYIRDVSQIGGGDIEMQRDGYNILGLKVGGCSDIYVRTAAETVKRKFELEGTPIPGTNLVQIFIGKDVYPGFYTLLSVKKREATDLDPGLKISSGSYNKDTSGLPYDDIPNITVLDARYTRFQTLLLQVEDPDYSPDDPYYAVTLLGLPNIAEIQDYVSQRQVRDPNNDMLVKAAIPVLTSVSLTVEYVAGDLEISAEALELIIKDVVNSTKFEAGKLNTSIISHAVQCKLPGNAAVKPSIDVLGKVLYPNNATKTMRTTTELEVETVPSTFTSPRTTSFFAESVAVTLKLVKRLQV